MKLLRSLTIVILVIFLFGPLTLMSQTPLVQHRVFLLGNFVDLPLESEVFLTQLENAFNKSNSPFTLLLNGDLTNQPIDHPSTIQRLGQLEKILRIVDKNPKGRAILIPGDRDWNNSGKGGQKNVNQLETAVKKMIKKNDFSRSKWAISDGCPTPRIFELDESLLLIAINTQWWNHPFDKPRAADGICSVITHQDFIEEIEDAVAENQDKNILIAGHHPFESIGQEAGNYSIVNHLLPIPVAGSFSVAYHRNIGTPNDINNSRLQPFVEGMKNLFYFHENLIYASGHGKHNSVIHDLPRANYMVNSGSLTDSNQYLAKHPGEIFKTKKGGLTVLNFFDDGRIEFSFLGTAEKLMPTMEDALFTSYCTTTPDQKTPVNYAYIPCDVTSEMTYPKAKKDGQQVEVIAGPEYKISNWKQMWWGKHYRTTWTQPVQTTYLNLDTTFGGLTIYKKGGGRQTTSLKFKSGNGTEFTFRSVNKDPSKALNYKLRPTVASTIARDQTSTEQPYGAMAIDPLLNKIGVLHVHPKLYVLPDDERLGSFQEKYGGLFGMLEENPGHADENENLFAGANVILRSNKLFRELYQSKSNMVNTEDFLRARMFDLLVGDWSKHADNWKWAGYKKGKSYLFRPIPRDRDHVFSQMDGIVPWLADREFGLPGIENFDYKLKGLRSLMWQARHMDRFLTTEATREDWTAAAEFIQQNISEKDIDQAIQNMPSETFETSGKEIAAKLKSRIKDLQEYASEYYQILAKEVDLVGSNEPEYFEITRSENKTVTVKVFSSKDHQKGDEKWYERTFLPHETNEIHLFGLGGKDVFDFQGDGSKDIVIRALGGPGEDLFKENGKKYANKTLIYDKGDNTKVEIDKGAQIVNHWNSEIYEYDQARFKYNTYLPLAYLSYSNFNGIALTGGVSFTRHKFDKTDYSSKHQIRASISSNGNRAFHYQSRFHQAIKDWDFILRGIIENPDRFREFYDLGNNTKLITELDDAGFYDIVYNNYNLSLGIGREFWRKSSFDLMLGLERGESLPKENTILKTSTSEGLFFGDAKLSIIPIEVKLDLDFRDESGFPYNGTRLVANYFNGSIISGAEENSNFGVADAAIEFYTSTPKKNPLTLGLRLGGAVSHGMVPYFHLPNIGSSTGLRGFTRNRFAGESAMFLNSELRLQLFEKYTSFVPIKFGVKAFYDTGRVWVESEANGGGWHNGYGAGFYLVPFSESFTLSVSLAWSDEESFFPVIGIGKALK